MSAGELVEVGAAKPVVGYVPIRCSVSRPSYGRRSGISVHQCSSSERLGSAVCQRLGARLRAGCRPIAVRARLANKSDSSPRSYPLEGPGQLRLQQVGALMTGRTTYYPSTYANAPRIATALQDYGVLLGRGGSEMSAARVASSGRYEGGLEAVLQQAQAEIASLQRQPGRITVSFGNKALQGLYRHEIAKGEQPVARYQTSGERKATQVSSSAVTFAGAAQPKGRGMQSAVTAAMPPPPPAIVPVPPAPLHAQGTSGLGRAAYPIPPYGGWVQPPSAAPQSGGDGALRTALPHLQRAFELQLQESTALRADNAQLRVADHCARVAEVHTLLTKYQQWAGQYLAHMRKGGVQVPVTLDPTVVIPITSFATSMFASQAVPADAAAAGAMRC